MAEHNREQEERDKKAKEDAERQQRAEEELQARLEVERKQQQQLDAEKRAKVGVAGWLATVSLPLAPCRDVPTAASAPFTEPQGGRTATKRGG